MFRDLGAETLRADDVARELVRPGSSLLAQIVSEFGREMLTPEGELDRERMGGLIFEDEQARARYDALFHPVLQRAMVDRIREARRNSGARLLAVEAAIMGQLGLADELDGLVFVDAPEDVRVKRLLLRDGGSRERALARVRGQTMIEEVRSRCQWIVDGSMQPAQLREQAAQIYQDILALNTSDM